MPFFIIFVIIPFAEIMVFMAVGEHIGLFTTLILAFATAIIGGAVVKHQGMQTLMNVRGSMDKGQLPAGALFDGVCLLIAGAMLITPGFITDIAGFSLLVPKFRTFLRTQILARTQFFSSTTTRTQSYVLEGEFETVDSDDDEN